MSIQNVTSECWILTMFIRDDEERFLLGSGSFAFKDSQQHFAPDTIVSDVVDVQGGDGSYIVGQVRRTLTQDFDGFIGDASCSKTQIETLRRQFIAFFQKGHIFEVVYIFPDGSAIKRQRGFVTDAPEVRELYQVFPEYHVALNFEDVSYYSYDEDENGNEIYNQSATVALYGAIGGGLIWDAKGIVWNAYGSEWDGGQNGTATLNINSITTIYPLWRVTGRAEYPQLYNATTNSTIKYNGIVRQGQTLEIDMLRRTAKLNGANVLPHISGEWVSFAPGVNRMRYDADNDYAPNSKIEWAEVVA